MSYQNWHCQRCNYDWGSYVYSRQPQAKSFKPKRCARCRSPHWNKPVTAKRRKASETLKRNNALKRVAAAKRNISRTPARVRR